MSTHNIRFYGELMKIILQLSSYTLLIWSSAEWQTIQTLMRLLRVFNVCPDLSFQKHWIITISEPHHEKTC